MATTYVKETLPTPLNSTSEQPTLFDGTTRLYISYVCPFAQRVWIARNYKGLQDKIKLVAIDLPNRPAWFKEKVNPENKVPALEHNNKITGESLDLLKYLDSNFEGPALFPTDPAKKDFADELLAYTDTMTKTGFGSLRGKDPAKDASIIYDYMENALSKFNNGPFFLGEFSMVDIAYIPFIEKFDLFCQDVFKYDLTAGRPKLGAWFQEMNKLDAYTCTKMDKEKLLTYMKNLFLVVNRTEWHSKHDIRLSKQ